MPAHSATEVEVEARVEAFVAGALTDDTAAGSTVHDATELRLLAPAELAGRELRVHHDRALPPENPWRRPGARLRFRIEREDLDPAMTLFDGAIRGLAELP